MTAAHTRVCPAGGHPGPDERNVHTNQTPLEPLTPFCFLRHPDRAPNGVGVKALRPLRGRATPEP